MSHGEILVALIILQVERNRATMAGRVANAGAVEDETPNFPRVVLPQAISPIARILRLPQAHAGLQQRVVLGTRLMTAANILLENSDGITRPKDYFIEKVNKIETPQTYPRSIRIAT